MRYVLALLLTLACPSFALAQTVPPGYRLVCRNGICSLQRIATFAPTIYGVAAPIVNTSYTPTVSATFTAPPLPEAPMTVAAGTLCNCAVTGVCTCDPGTCSCPSCLNGQVRMGSAVTQYAAAPYTYYSVASPTVMYAAPTTATVYSTPRGGLTVSYDAWGNLYTAHTGGAYARQLQRHLHRGYRKFGIAP